MSGERSSNSLWMRARQLLASYRGDRNLGAGEWLEVAREAHAFAVSTFPEARRERALAGFVERNCVGQAPRTIAVFAVALRLLGEKKLRGEFGFGDCLEAAALACGTTVDELPPPRDPVEAQTAATRAEPQVAPKQDGLIGRAPSVSVEYWN